MKSLNKILYVEDDLGIQKVANLSLCKIGKFEVKICSTGYEAITEAPEFQPDLILLDRHMPEIDGIETFRKMQEIPQLANIPKIFLTGCQEQEDIETFYALGAIGIISKPFSPMELPKKILEIWNNNTTKAS